MRLIVASHYFLPSIGSGSSSVTSSDLGCVLQKPLSAQRHHHAWLGWFLSCRVDFGRWYTSIYTLLCHLPRSCILLSIKMTQQTWCRVWLQLLFHPIQGRGASFPACLAVSCAAQNHPERMSACLHQSMSVVLGMWPSSWFQAMIAQVRRIPSGSTQCDSGKKQINVFLESQMLYRALVFIFCGLQQVLLGRRVKVEGAGLFSLIIGVLNILQNSGVESCNPNSWEKVQACILSFQKMPTWISLIEVEQPQGKFSGQTISNSK